MRKLPTNELKNKLIQEHSRKKQLFAELDSELFGTAKGVSVAAAKVSPERARRENRKVKILERLPLEGDFLLGCLCEFFHSDENDWTIVEAPEDWDERTARYRYIYYDMCSGSDYELVINAISKDIREKLAKYLYDLGFWVSRYPNYKGPLLRVRINRLHERR